jgi:hypothetical protein
MLRSLKAAVLFSGALFIGASLGAGLAVPSARAGATAQPPHDPNKKNAGEPCKSSDECQKHHSCAKVGDKNICQAPPPPRLPPGAVT